MDLHSLFYSRLELLPTTCLPLLYFSMLMLAAASAGAVLDGDALHAGDTAAPVESPLILYLLATSLVVEG